MQTESIELSFLSIFAFLTFFIFLLVSKYSYKLNNGILLDNDFTKPQAFHNEEISRSGGLASLISLFIFFGIYNLLFSKILYEYIFVCSTLFFVGYLDDLKIRIKPIFRLLLMTVFLIIIINFLSIEIKNIDLIFLDSWLNNQIFSTFFILLCFLFIVNGANLIDGFNGLLTINLIIINSVLLFINLGNNHLEFSMFLSAQIIILISFLLFNFPKAKMFLGDSGSYLFGSLVALNTIITNNLNLYISSFFFCILLSYLFIEVFFSFFRKIYQKKSPVFPDDEHLHMLSFIKISNYYGKDRGNYINSTIINIIFGILVLPSIYFAENGLVCKYWFFSLIIIYSLIYVRIYRLTKN
jgi:UDP-N-acetylmuramyl pentapeptide phosphotransferase/UDP-N-acetylglucosamine-1-phosphate transferase